MGAQTFETVAFGSDAKQAFQRAVSEACYMHGHGGYTGTIAEKHESRLFRRPEGSAVETREAMGWVRTLSTMAEGERAEWLDEHVPEGWRDVVLRAAPVYDDKWGPAVCMALTEQEQASLPERMRGGEGERGFVFGGWASS